MDDAHWREVGRVLVADVLSAVAVGAVMVLGSGPAARGEAPPRRPLDLLAWVLMGVAAAVLLGRRRWPRSSAAQRQPATWSRSNTPAWPTRQPPPPGGHAAAARIPRARGD